MTTTTMKRAKQGTTRLLLGLGLAVCAAGFASPAWSTLIPTTTALTSTNPSTLGSSAALVAIVSTATYDARINGGTVNFMEGTTVLGSGTLRFSAGSTSSWKATLDISTLSQGTHTLTATYVGSAAFAASTSAPLTQTVGPKIPTTTVLASANPSAGGAVALVAIVSTATYKPAISGGTVNFMDGTTVLGSGTLGFSAGSTSSWKATLNVSTLSPGPRTLTAAYVESAAFAASTSAALTQTRIPTTTVLASGPNPSTLGSSVALVATVSTATYNAGINGGTVNFMDGTTVVGSGTLGFSAGSTSSWKATLNVSALSRGTRTLTAAYVESAAFAASTSAAITQTVNSPPAAPNISIAVGGNAQATVTFTAPASNGGFAITGYTVTSLPAGGLDSNAGTLSLSHVIIGLVNGNAYTFTVTATNALGTSVASAASNSVTPATVPNAPSSVIAVGGVAQATVSFTAPASDGGSAITSYTVTSNPGGIIRTCAASPCTVAGLTNGTAYAFTVAAANVVGASIASAASNSVTPVLTVPDAPTSVTAAGGNTQARVNFTASAFDGGSAITMYTATSNPGGVTGSCATSPCIVTGLTNGSAYTFTVTATNAVGTSVASAASNAVDSGIQSVVYYIHTDHLNTPRLVADATGTPVWRWDQQEPFGVNVPDENPSGLGSFDLPLRLPGQYYDKETGLHYNYFRDYDPSIGRYTASDPIGVRGGLNTYAYVTSRPLEFIDSLGLLKWSGSFQIESLGWRFWGGIRGRFSLVSECDADGNQGQAEVVGYGAFLGPFPTGKADGSVKMVDGEIRAMEGVFRGTFSFRNFGVQVGPVSLMKATLWLGEAISTEVKVKGFEIAALSTIGGFADVLSFKLTPCGCKEK